MVDVPDVELDPLRPGEPVAPADLRPARNAGEHLEPAPLEVRVLVDLVAERRTGADHAHLPAQDVEKLWQLVERPAAQKCADARDPRIALRGEVAGTQQVRALDHRPELEDLERAPVPADPLLPEDHRAARLELDRERSRKQERRSDDDADHRDNEVERALRQLVAARGQRVPSAGVHVSCGPRVSTRSSEATDAAVTTRQYQASPESGTRPRVRQPAAAGRSQ